MRFFLVLLAITALVLAGGSTAIAKQDAVGLSIDATIDPAPKTADIDEQQVRNLVFNLQSSAGKPLSGRILLTYPAVLDAKMRTETIDFDLSKQNAAEVISKIVIPEGTPPGKYTFPVSVLVQGKKYVDLELLVTKSISWYYIGPFEGGPQTAHDRAFDPERS